METEPQNPLESIEKNIWNRPIAYGIPLYVFLPLCAVILYATFMESLPGNMVGATAFLFFIAGGLVYIGDRLPIWKDWLGGGLIFTLIIGGIASYFRVLPESSIKIITGFYYEPTNMLEWCIAALIAGSILSMPRPYLIKALPLYIPVIFGGILGSYMLTFIGGNITGYGGIKAILAIANPIEGGGLGAGAIPMSQIYSKTTGMDFDEVFSMLIPAVVIGNIVSIFLASILNQIGKMKTHLTGNGVLMPQEKWMPKGGIPNVARALTEETIVQGWAIAVSLFVIGYILKDFLPIHYFAITVILTAIVKIFHFLPDTVEQSAGHFYKFIATGFYGPLLLGIGLTHLRLDIVLHTVNPIYLLLTFLAVLGAGLGAAVAGKLCKLYPIESALTGGLCMANMGGSGDIAILAGAHRMELMPFAQISSRIGGAIMLIIAQLTISVMGKFL